MAIVDPGKGRAIIEDSGMGMRITIPAAPSFQNTTWLVLSLLAWAGGEVFVLWHLFDESPDPLFGTFFMLVWLAMWTLGGIRMIDGLLWNLAGQEVIELSSTALKRRKRLPVFRRSKEYSVANISGLRPAALADQPSPSKRQNMSTLSFKDGTIAFDYGRDTHLLATGLDEADAQYVIAQMCKQVKSLRSQDNAAPSEAQGAS